MATHSTNIANEMAEKLAKSNGEKINIMTQALEHIDVADNMLASIGYPISSEIRNYLLNAEFRLSEKIRGKD